MPNALRVQAWIPARFLLVMAHLTHALSPRPRFLRLSHLPQTLHLRLRLHCDFLVWRSHLNQRIPLSHCRLNWDRVMPSSKSLPLYILDLRHCPEVYVV
jgi:hypothetical protein